MNSSIQSGKKGTKGKKNTAHSKKYIQASSSYINYILVALIAIFLIVIPFYRGLYFRENYIPAVIYMSAVFLLYIMSKLIKKDYKIISSYLDIAILLLPITYLISFFFSINAKNAFDMILKYAAYFMIYKIVSGICKGSEAVKRFFSWSVLLSNYLVAISGMLTVAGLLDLKGVTEFNRLYGVYQYPNTTAAVLGAGILIAVGLMLRTTNIVEKICCQVVLTTVFAGFALTLSAGGILVLAALVIFNFLIIDTKSKLDYLVHFIIAIAANGLIFMDYMKNALKGPFILYYLLSLVISIALQLLYSQYIQKSVGRLSPKKIAVIIVIIIAFVAIAGIIILNMVGISLPSLVSQFLNVELKSRNALDRIVFLKDGFKMFSDNFLVGFGGGAWQDIYYKYQSFSYDSKEVHSYYVQLMVETGILGAIALLAVLGLLIKNFFVSTIKNKSQAYLPFYMGAFMLLGHATIDFDLSLVAPMMLLWSLVGISASEFESALPFSGRLKNTGPVLATLGLIVLYFSASMYSGMVNGNNAAKILKGDAQKALSLYEKAMKADRYNGAYRMDYAQIMANRYAQSRNAEDYDKFRKAMDDIEKYEPYNVQYIAVKISLLLGAGLIDEGMILTNELVANQPLVEGAYMTKLNVNYSIAKQYFEAKQHEEAIPYLDNMIEVESELEEAKSKAIKPFEVDKKVYDMIGLAKNWKENAERIINR